MTRLQTMLEKAEADQAGALARLFELIAIPSISSHEQHRADCDRAADFLVREASHLGFDAKRLPTSAHDVVLACYYPEDKVAQARPGVLFYGHYDVQTRRSA